MRADGTFGPGVRLPYPINTEYDDRQPNVSQNGREIVFASDRRTANSDSPNFDIFYARKPWLFSRWRRVTNLSRERTVRDAGCERNAAFVVVGWGTAGVRQRRCLAERAEQVVAKTE